MDRNRKIEVMGIINLNDDSFYAGSRCSEAASAVEKAGRMLEEGADILDLGVCSTRPGADPVSAEEEWRRLEPALRNVREAFPDALISIDTTSSEIVRKAFDLIGDFIVNDISAGEDDAGMLPLAGRLGLTYVAMHKRGTPGTMQSLADYDDVTEEVMDYFRDFARKAELNEVTSWILDPGFGFAKTIEQNYEVLGNLDRFSEINPRILVGISRKSMVYKPLGISPEEALSATQVLHLYSLQKGASVLRVHDVAETVRTIGIYRRLFV